MADRQDAGSGDERAIEGSRGAGGVWRRGRGGRGRGQHGGGRGQIVPKMEVD